MKKPYPYHQTLFIFLTTALLSRLAFSNPELVVLKKDQLAFHNARGDKTWVVITGDQDLLKNPSSKRGIELAAKDYIPNKTHVLLRKVLDKKTTEKPSFQLFNPSRHTNLPLTSEINQTCILYKKGLYQTLPSTNDDPMKFKGAIAFLPFTAESSQPHVRMCVVIPAKRTHRDCTKGTDYEPVASWRGQDLDSDEADRRFIKQNSFLYYDVLEGAYLYNQNNPSDHVKFVQFCGIGAGDFYRGRGDGTCVEKNLCINAGELQILSFHETHPNHNLTIIIPANRDYWPQMTDSALDRYVRY